MTLAEKPRSHKENQYYQLEKDTLIPLKFKLQLNASRKPDQSGSYKITKD